uniref:Tumor protein p53-inducible protein 11 n=2 Tax=Macrostomum lignano TaxID=282301 RepID=A0A1I8GN54_9PLAT
MALETEPQVCRDERNCFYNSYYIELRCEIAILRKQSSGDLHSRLKTRKLLGVGETDDGDVHRSKLSQILGHSEQLHHRGLSWAARTWTAACGLACAAAATAIFFKPGLLFGHQEATELATDLVARLYACALMALAGFLCLSWRSSDRELARQSIILMAALAAANCALLWLHPAGWLPRLAALAMLAAAAAACAKFCQLAGG